MKKLFCLLTMLMFVGVAYAQQREVPPMQFHVMLQPKAVQGGEEVVPVHDEETDVSILVPPGDEKLALDMFQRHIKCNNFAMFAWMVADDKEQGADQYEVMNDVEFVVGEMEPAMRKVWDISWQRIVRDVFRTHETDKLIIARDQYLFCVDAEGMFVYEEF